MDIRFVSSEQCPKCGTMQHITDTKSIWCQSRDCDWFELIEATRGEAIRVDDIIVNMYGRPGVVRKVFDNGRIQVQHGDSVWSTYDSAKHLSKGAAWRVDTVLKTCDVNSISASVAKKARDAVEAIKEKKCHRTFCNFPECDHRRTL